MGCVRAVVAVLMVLMWTGPTRAEDKPPRPSCAELSSLFERTIVETGANAPPPPAAPDPQTADDRARDLAAVIAGRRQALDAAINEHGEESLDTANARLALARDLRRASLFNPALDELGEAEAIYRKLEPRGMSMAQLYRERGIIFSNMRRRDKAVDDLRAAIRLHAAAGPARNALLEALNNHTLAQVMRGLSRFDEALKALNRARSIYERDPDANAAALAEVLIDAFTIETRLDDWDRALKTITDAVDISQKRLGPYHGTTARALHNQAIAFRRAERYGDSFESLGRAFAIYDAADNGRRSADALDEAARTFGKLGCYPDAIRAETVALDGYRENYGPEHVTSADALARLGTYLRDSGSPAEAIARFTDSIALFDRLLGGENVRSAIVMRELAAAQVKRQDLAAAQATLLHSVRILDQENVADELRDSLRVLANLLAAQGNRNAAILIAKKAVNIQQEIRAANRNLPPELSASLAQRYRELYLFLADLLIAEGRMEEAQRVIDLIKSQEIIDFVRGGRPELLPVDSRAPLTKTERNTLAEIDRLLAQPFAAQAEYEALQAKKRKGGLGSADQARLDHLSQTLDRNFADFQNQVKALLDGLSAETPTVQGEIVQLHLDMLGQTQKKLRPFKGRAVTLQIASLAGAVHIFLTGPKTQVHRSVAIPRADLARLAFAAWNATSRGKPDAQAKLEKLYDVLIRPIAPDLKASGADVVMLNLEGFLRYVPFAALHDGEHYLIEDYALTVETTAANTQYQRAEHDRARAVGFGVTDALRDFVSLPGVADEMESLFEGTDGRGVFTGTARLNKAFSADEFAAALETEPQIVHVASHFKLEPGDETKSFLLLGTGDSLTLEAIRTDRRFQFTSVDLLTLSACETAGEVGSDGKEVESFATLAQAGGASSVMATLWPIADQSTADIMAQFYQGLLDGGLDKATALRKAQIAFIHAGEAPAVALNTSRGASPVDEPAEQGQPVPRSHPYFWSPFVLMGNWL